LRGIQIDQVFSHESPLLISQRLLRSVSLNKHRTVPLRLTTYSRALEAKDIVEAKAEEARERAAQRPRDKIPDEEVATSTLRSDPLPS
jgi:hypothetical protein